MWHSVWNIIRFDLYTRKWSLRRCYSRKPHVRLRNWSYGRTIPSPRAVRSPQVPPCQNNGKLAGTTMWTSLGQRLAYARTRVSSGKVSDGQVITTTNAMESPANKQSMATAGAAQPVRQSLICVSQLNPFDPLNFPHICRLYIV